MREVAEITAHTEPPGETHERFKIAASKANESKKLNRCVISKALQNRLKRLQGRLE